MSYYGEQLKQERMRKQRAEERAYKVAREECRRITYERAGGCCEWCGKPLVLKPSEARHAFEIAHIDEKIMRSKGGDPTNPDNCRCLCAECHLGKRHGRTDTEPDQKPDCGQRREASESVSGERSELEGSS
jgi:5-methylcytosine-specific restriction endonuclease McrA